MRAAELADLVHAMNREIGLGSAGLENAAARMPFRTAPPIFPRAVRGASELVGWFLTAADESKGL